MVLLAEMNHSATRPSRRLKRTVSPPIGTRTPFRARLNSRTLPTLHVDFPVLLEAVRSDLGGALALTVIVVGGTDPEINRRALEFMLDAARPHDAIWFVRGSAQDTAFLHARVVEVDPSDPFDCDIFEHLPADVLMLSGDATCSENVDAWRERAGCTLLDVRSPYMAEAASMAERDGRFRLWMGGPALLPHRSSDVALSIAETVTEAITCFDAKEDRQRLLRPYVSGLFECGRTAVFNCAKDLLTYADRMQWPAWAAGVLSCWYIPSSEQGFALVADGLQSCFPEDVHVRESFCGGMFHLARISDDVESYFDQIGGVIGSALAESPVRYQSVRAVLNIVLQAVQVVVMRARSNRFTQGLTKFKRGVLHRMKAA
jgi:hypothetical protein